MVKNPLKPGSQLSRCLPAATPLQVKLSKRGAREAVRPNSCDAIQFGSAVCAETRHASAQRRRTEDIHGPGDRLLDPGLASEPVVIGPTDRAMSIAIKHNAPQESLTVGLKTSGYHATSLRAFDHDHTHVSLP
jgi:hypothetical protein